MWFIITDCVADFTSGNREEITRIENLIIGDTYYISVLNASGERSARGSFTICINEPPLNDLCTGAVSLDVNSDNNCTLQTAGTTVGATPSMATKTCGINLLPLQVNTELL
ncbi:MAG: hypothetical protein IPP72_15320 [Chitinophagaceae bacterium]|nr:hypothetical protein [Chitinophagaceae bacterium]